MTVARDALADSGRAEAGPEDFGFADGGDSGSRADTGFDSGEPDTGAPDSGADSGVEAGLGADAGADVGPDAADAMGTDPPCRPLERASVGSTGVESNANAGTITSLSDDGRYVAFDTAGALSPLDTNGVSDVFVHDRMTRQTVLASVTSTGAVGRGASAGPSMSGDGRFVAFSSAAVLVPEDSNGAGDIYVRDMIAQTVELASVSSTGTIAAQGSLHAAISADGRYVAFATAAANLVAGDSNGQSDIFVHDRNTGETTRVSVATGGAESNGRSLYPALSGDGRYVVFHSLATTLTANDTDSSSDVFLHDRMLGTTELVSVGVGGESGSGISQFAMINHSGSAVVWTSSGENLVTGDSNGVTDVFFRDMTSGTTSRVNIDSSGNQSNGSASGFPDLSDDGRYVIFSSNDSNLVPGDTNGFTDIFVRDRTLGTTVRMTLTSTGGQSNGRVLSPRTDSAASVASFASGASNLVSGDRNGVEDVFVAPRCP